MLSLLKQLDFKSPLAKILGRLGLVKENTNDKLLYFSKSNKSFLTYRVLGKSVMVLGDPVGLAHEMEELINDFYCECKSKNQYPCFFQTSSSFIDIYKKLNLKVSTVGNEGLVNLVNFDLKNPSRTGLREQMRILDGFRYKIRYYKDTIDNVFIQKLQSVSNNWSNKLITVMTVEDMVGNIVAFVNLVPYKQNDLLVDLIRKSTTAPEGTLEYLLTHAILFFKELGYQQLSLGLIPLITSQDSDVNLKEKFIDILEPRYFISNKQ